MNRLFKIVKENWKAAGLATLASVFVFLFVPVLLHKVDPSSKILDLSILNVILSGAVILTLAWTSVWVTINTVFKRTLDAFSDLKDFRERFADLPDDVKFNYMFKTVWLVAVLGVIAFKPILFVFQ